MAETKRSRTYYLVPDGLRLLADFVETANRVDTTSARLVQVDLTPEQESFLLDAWEALRLRTNPGVPS